MFSRLVTTPTFIKFYNFCTKVASSPFEVNKQNFVNMEIEPISALSDNYMYLIIDKHSKECAVVDPVEPKKVLAAVKEQNLTLTHLLTTHHHWDHAGGNKELLSTCGKHLKVFGGDNRIDGVGDCAKHGDTFQLGKSITIKCLFTPCHTSGHICYYVTTESGDKAVFTGDTLFIAGCGRFFEGTAEQMHNALVEILGKLPGDTKVFCGHEYTVKNLQFAATVEPDNENVINKLAWAKSQREANLGTVPSTIDEEHKINPFMRVAEKSVLQYSNTHDPIVSMATLRQKKDKF